MRASSNRTKKRKDMEYKNLRIILTVLFLVLSIIPLSLLTFFSYYHFRSSLHTSITQNLSQITIDKAMSINNWLFERVSDARTIAQSPWTAAALYDPQKRDSFNNYLTLIEQSYGYYDELFILDKNGDFVAGTGGREENKSGRDYFANARDGIHVITDIRKSETTGKPTMLISFPVKDEYGKVVGVLVERIKLDLISKIMKQIKVGKTGESYLLDARGYFLTESKFEPDCILNKRISTEGYENCIKHHQGVGEYFDYRGKTVLGSYLWMPERKWCLMVEQDVKEAFSQISTLKNITMAIYFVTIVLVAGASLICSGRIIKVLKEKDDKLEHRTKELIRAEKLSATGQLAAGVAHEINNPIAVIMGRAEFLISELGGANSLILKSLKTIEQESEKAATTVQKLLSFTRQREPKLELVDINMLLETSLNLMNHQALMEKIAIIKELDSNMPKVRADSHQIEQVFVNIILNAIQAMPGGGKLLVGTGAKGELVEIKFLDSGCGIPESDISMIFAPFFTTKARGTGLGLAISKEIIESHNGSLRIESGSNKGTVVTIELPCQIGRE